LGKRKGIKKDVRVKEETGKGKKAQRLGKKVFYQGSYPVEGSHL